MSYTKISKIVAILVAAVILAGAAVFFIFGAVRGGAALNGGFEAVYTTTCEDASAIAKAVAKELGITPAVKVNYKAEGGYTGTVKLVFDGVELSDEELAKVDAAMAKVDEGAVKASAGAVKGQKTLSIDAWGIVIAILVVAAASFVYGALRFKKVFGVKAAVLAAVTAIVAPLFAYALDVICRINLTDFSEYLLIAASVAASAVAFIAFELILTNKAAGTAKPFSDEVVNGSVCTLSKLLAIPAAVITVAIIAVAGVAAISGFALAASAVIAAAIGVVATVIVPLYVFAPMMAKN